MAVNLHVSFAQVRFLADLVNAKVVTSSSIMSLFDTFLTITYEPGIPQVCVCVCVCVCTILCIMYLWIICFGMLSFLYTNLHLWMCVLRCSVVNQPFLRPFFFFTTTEEEGLGTYKQVPCNAECADEANK